MEPITTSDTPFAAFLKYNKHQLVGFKKDPNDAKRLVYIFIRQDDTESLSRDFYSNNVEVEPRYFFKCASEMVRKLNEEKFKQ